ncbi:CoA-transferase family III domain-containing protein [Fennellomyces sp. T-0311]|nr:CoA-transferase family III domain-containing protein [Fennellomyces sp. T-0311]
MVELAVPQEARRLLKLLVKKNPVLEIPEDYVDTYIHFKGGDLPVQPGGLKSGALSAASHAALAAVADQFAQDRYGTEPSQITIDTDHSGYFLASPALCKFDNAAPDWEDGGMWTKPMHASATCIYPTKDGRWFQLHGDLDCRPLLKDIGIEDAELATRQDAQDILTEWTMQHTAEDLEAMMIKYRHSGSICYDPKEWLGTDMGYALAKKSVCNVLPLGEPREPTPYPPANHGRILEGIKVVEMARVIAGPTIGQTLAHLGAQVIKVNPPHLRDITALQYTLTVGKHTVALDAREPDQKAKIDQLVAKADVFINGFRPGSLDRLGFGKDSVLDLANGRSIVYVDENCYGLEGPYKGRPGWQQIADAASGASVAQAKSLGMESHAVLPPLPISDLLTGVLGAVSILCALRDRSRKGGSYSVVASLTAYNMFCVSDEVGIYPSEIVQEVERTFEFGPIKPSDNVSDLLVKVVTAWKKKRPDHMDFEGKYFIGFEDGPFGRTRLLAPVAQIEKYPSKWDHPPRPYGHDQPTFDY